MHLTASDMEDVIMGQGRWGGGDVVLPVKSLLLSVNLLPEVKPVLYILKHNPHLSFV